MVKLYGNRYSRANRVRWALEVMGTDYQEEEIALGDQGTGSARFLEINPNGRIPVINDDGLVLFESVPICLYLTKKYAPTTLYVDTTHDEGLLLQWSVWAVTELEKHVETASLHATWLDAEKRNSSIAANEQAEVSRCLTMLEQAITGNGFLVAGRFTIADLIVSEVLTGLVHAKVSLDSFLTLKSYLKMNLSRASAKKAFAADIIHPYLT